MTQTIGGTMTNVDQQSIIAKNGCKIHVTFFLPDWDPMAAVLIVPAMGVSQRYYAPFATWIASQGYLAATFDYAGMGQSNNGDIRKLNLTIVDWAYYDCDAMIDAVSAAAPSRPLYWLGHSLGGQILGFVPDRSRLSKAVTIAAGSGYWLENAPSLKWKVWWLWFFVAPLATRIFGYFPGRRLRKVGDLPRGVMNQWRQWCLNPDYAVGVGGPAARASFAALTIPIASLSFVDDELLSARSTASLLGFYENAPRTLKRISPSDVGAKRIGHFGFFSERFKESLWRVHLLPELS
jgi:predicted alpha/beta hydrolase